VIDKVRNSLVSLPDTARLILDLSKDDIKHRFSGSIFGIVWALIRPVIITAVFIFVFEVGLRQNDLETSSYTTWFLIGFVPWMFMSETWLMASSSLLEYGYLIKKTNFNSWLIPTIKMVSGLYIHILFLFLTAGIIYYLDGITVWYTALYYLFCSVLLVGGLSYLVAALVPFIPDVRQFVDLAVQILFWTTPVIWNTLIFKDKTFELFGHTILTLDALKLNPFYYIIEGYRSAILDRDTIPADAKSLWFFAQVAVIWALAYFLFKRLKPYYNEVI
jgi:teichoic acid transport system permease protein